MTIEIEEAVKLTADSIFENYTLHDITNLSQALTNASQAKHDELRNLVASQYKDLLHTADRIIGMDTLAKRSDKELYNLSFMSNPRLSKNITIERNVEKWLPEGGIQLPNKHLKAQKKADLFLEMSKLLNLSAADSAQHIEDVLRGLPLNEEWFKEKKEVLVNKIEELEMVILNKIPLMSFEDLVKVDQFVTETKWFNKNKFQEALYEAVSRLVTLENLKLVLSKFEKFSERLQDRYKSDVESNIFDLEKLINTIDEKGTKIELYTLDLDDDYLQKIKFLTNGLIYQKYQLLSTEIDRALETLKFVEVINKSQYTTLKKQLSELIIQFKAHIEKEDNKPLVKYLDTLM